MTSPLEAAQDAAPGRIDRVESLLLAVTLANEPNPLGCIDDARRCDGFRYEVMSAAGKADPIWAAQDAAALASEMTGAAS